MTKHGKIGGCLVSFVSLLFLKKILLTQSIKIAQILIFNCGFEGFIRASIKYVKSFTLNCKVFFFLLSILKWRNFHGQHFSKPPSTFQLLGSQFLIPAIQTGAQHATTGGLRKT